MIYCVPFLEVCFTVFVYSNVCETGRKKKKKKVLHWNVLTDKEYMIILLKSVGQIPKQDVFSYSQGWEKNVWNYVVCYVLNVLSAPLCPPYWGPAFLPRQTKHQFMLKDFPERLGDCSCIFYLCLGEKRNCLSRVSYPNGLSLPLAWRMENGELSASTFKKGKYQNYFWGLRIPRRLHGLISLTLLFLPALSPEVFPMFLIQACLFLLSV